MATELRLRLMTRDDIPLGMELKTYAGWNQTEADWRRFLELAPQGCFVAEWRGRGVGTAVAVAFEGKVGWLAMVLVHPEFRRRGIGTRLLQQGIGHLEQRGVVGIKLDATPLGKKVYDRLGFVEEYPVERWQGWGRPMSLPVASPEVRPMKAGDLPAVVAFDRPCYGADRGRLLASIYRDCPEHAYLCGTDEEPLRGYALVRPGTQAWHLAPSVAMDPEAAEGLLRAVLNGLADQPIFWDLVGPNPWSWELAKRYGFTRQRSFTRMVRGANPFPGRPEFIYATSGPELG
jgi:GNAT superfamily N-acetyltransferase